jgi:hypothetical protein
MGQRLKGKLGQLAIVSGRDREMPNGGVQLLMLGMKGSGFHPLHM